ncbi:tetratricopeptide repeat protein [Halotalea alkalilenta]|uniref:tetratricopeptide repeat protein n=1 Tax=Halotalea alkalilenta TaxID=376489 RepID=UPI0009DD8FC4|nr:tetratricopeptide repeat protein [Halotalea alkalilenta]
MIPPRLPAGRLAALALAALLGGCAVASTGDGRNPGAASAYAELGMGYLGQGEGDRARQAFERALEQDPHDPTALHGIALLEHRAGNDEVAERYYQRTLLELPRRDQRGADEILSETPVRNNYAALLYERQRYGEACEQLERAAKDTTYAGRARVLVNLSQCQLHLGETAAARASLNLAERIAPDQPTVLLALAYLDYAERDMGASRARLTQYERLAGLTREGRALHDALENTADASPNTLEPASSAIDQP